MRRKPFWLVTISILLITNLIFTSATFATEEYGTSSLLDTTALDRGLLGVSYEVKTDTKTKIIIEKEGNKYIYNLIAINKSEYFPLQLGNGEYAISILENIKGTQYKVVVKEKVDLTLNHPHAVYLNSIQTIHWDESMQAVKKAQELTQNARSDEEKVKVIYEYVISNIEYDYDKAKAVATDYNPEIDNTVTSRQGICYDYSALFAAMLRSVGVPTKLVKGSAISVKEYHAWNEVYLSEIKQWVTIDTTVDAGLKKSNNNKSVEMIKDSKDYKAKYEY